MKKIMLLGGNFIQQTITLAARHLGYYIISVDYLPDNPAHKFADEYHNISTIDKEKVLELAMEKQIDGIVSYGSDVSAPTAAYVAEKMGLPTNPFDSVMIMTHKDLFRDFMKKNGFPMPAGEAFSDYDSARAFLDEIRFPVMVKPIDSSGSKGVTKIRSAEEFRAAWDEAMSYSISKRVIIEEFIEKIGYQIDGDIFADNGEIVFWGICDQHVDKSCAPHTPVGLSYPSIQAAEYQKKAKALVEKMFGILNMTMGAYNLEYIVGSDGEIYILEIGPRNGGNMITDATYLATGVHLAELTAKQAVGEKIGNTVPVRDGNACSFVIHSTEDGYFSSLDIDDEIRDNVVFTGLTVKQGEKVERYHNASYGIGYMLFSFDDTRTMCEALDNMNDHVRVRVTEEPMEPDPQSIESVEYMNAFNIYEKEGAR